MADETSASGGAGGSASGATEEKEESRVDSTQKTNETKENRTVSWDAHNRALADLNKEKESRRALEVRIGDLESKSLQEKQDFKGLYEREKAAREKAEVEAKEVRGWAVSTQRFNAVGRASL